MLGAWRHVRHMSTPNNALSRGVRGQKFREWSRPRKERPDNRTCANLRKDLRPDLHPLANENGPPKRADEERKRGKPLRKESEHDGRADPRDDHQRERGGHYADAQQHALRAAHASIR